MNRLPPEMTGMTSDCIISTCGKYRYALTRRWGQGPTALFIMLNPSTADASEDDPTIRRCMSFARREGCGAIRVENLFAFRSTSPDEMFKTPIDLVGETDRYIVQAVGESDGPLIAAWGGDKRARVRANRVSEYLVEGGAIPKCLGRTKYGSPRHPLYLKKDAPLTNLIQESKEN